MYAKRVTTSIFSSAGIGRTGTFIALDILTEQGQTRGYVDPFECVTTLRNQRANMVQTKVSYYKTTRSPTVTCSVSTCTGLH